MKTLFITASSYTASCNQKVKEVEAAETTATGKLSYSQLQKVQNVKCGMELKVAATEKRDA
jgi:hypothetical protein